MAQYKIKFPKNPEVVRGLPMDQVHHVQLRILGKLFVRLPIDPDLDFDGKYHLKDKFTLVSSDGSYSKSLTVKDDQIAGNRSLDLLYKQLDRKLSYTLKVEHAQVGQCHLPRPDRYPATHEPRVAHRVVGSAEGAGYAT